MSDDSIPDANPPQGPASEPSASEASPSENKPAETRTELSVLGSIAASIAILGGAVVLFMILAGMRRKPPVKPYVETKTGVEVVEVGPRQITPSVEGYGRARPTRRVTISAEVGGRVATIHTALEDGRLVTKGATVVAIDSADATASLAQAQAQLASAQGEVERLVATKHWLAQRLELAEDTLRLELADLDRARDLKRRGIDSERGQDQAERAVVRARDAKLTLQQSAGLLGPQLAVARARVAEARARLTTATRDLERCQIVLPFSGLLAQVQVEAHQQVAPGQTLFELWEVERLEIPVSLSLGDAFLLSEQLGTAPSTGRVEVRYELPGQTRRWPGRVLRFEPLQGETQTLRAVVEVESRQGLVPEAFCHVILEGPPLEMRLALPVAAIQEGGRVYLAEPDDKGQDRLAIKTIRTGKRSGAWVEVLAGLERGSRVIVSPLERAIEGLPLVTNAQTRGVSK
jgi:multidrug resistance efflux pump